MEPEFLADAVEAGFTEDQAQFMWRYVSLDGHRHEIEDVDGLEEALEEVEEEIED